MITKPLSMNQFFTLYNIIKFNMGSKFCLNQVHAQSSMHEFPRDQSLFFPYTSWIDVVILIPGESYKNS